MSEIDDETNPAIREERDAGNRLQAVSVTLSEPVNAHGQALATVRFPVPRIKLIKEVGMPFAVGDGPAGKAMQINSSAILFYAWKLAKVPPNTFDELGAEDYMNIQQAILLFFGDSATPTTSTS